MPRLWDKGLPLDERILRFTAGEDHLLDERLVAYDVRASVAHARMLAAQGLLAADDWQRDLRGARGARRRARGRRVVDRARRRGRARRARAPADRADRRGRRPRASRPLAQRPGARRAAALSARRDRGARGRDRRRRRRARARRGEQGSIALPGYTHMQPAMPSTVALWARGFAAELEDDRAGLERVRARADQNPLGSAAGYGVPNLPVDRERDDGRARLRAHARARDGRAAVARQGGRHR